MFEKPNLKPPFWGPIFEAMFDHRVHILVQVPTPLPETSNNYGREQGHQSHCKPSPVQQNTPAACP